MGGSSKKQTIGYRIYLGMHMILCHGTVDALHEIKFGGKSIGMGGPTTSGVDAAAEDLFGGEEREGGISGRIDIERGDPAQGRNDYLVAQLGSDVPAFRRVCGIVFRKLYVGMSVYLKKPAFRVTRIHKHSSGATQWYDAKAQIGSRVMIPGVTTGTPTGEVSDMFIFDPEADFFVKNTVTADIPNIGSMMFRSYVPDLAGGGWAYMPGPFTMGGATAHPGDGILLRKWFNLTGFTPVDGKIRIYLVYSDGYLLMLNDTFITLDVFDEHSGYVDIPVSSLLTENLLSFYSPASETVILIQMLVTANVELMTTTTTAATYSGNPDMNPAHIIRECLTDGDWGMGYNPSDIDDVAFTAAADTLYAEAMGISILWDKQTPIEDFIKEVIKHIDAVLYVDRRTGKFVLKLIRDDYDLATVPVFGPSNVERIDDYTVVTDGEFVNEVIVNYRNGENGEDASIPATDIALAQMQGGTISTTVSYMGFSNATIAGRVALRDLKTLSSPLISCMIYAYGVAQELNPGAVIKLSWPDYGIDSVPMRVTGVAIGNGKGKRVRLTVTQDTFGLPNLLFVPPVSEWIPPSFDLPTQANVPSPFRMLTEAPYFELVQREGQLTVDNLLSVAPDAGYLIAAGSLAGSAFNMSLYRDSGAGYTKQATVDFSPTAMLATPMTKTATIVAISNAERVAQAGIGSHCQIGDELCAIVARSDTQLTLVRGVLDTVPDIHPFGARILFWDAFGGTDAIEYAAGETVNVKLVTGSPGATFDLSPIPSNAVTFDSRAIRPYPPGNVKVNGEYFPTLITGDLVVTWASRNRLQQTAPHLVGFTDGDVTTEPGTTYNVRVYDDTDALIKNVTGLTVKTFTYTEADEITDGGKVNGKLTIELESERDGFTSWQKHSIVLKRAGYGFNYGEYYGGL